MVWVRIEDNLTMHPKIVAAGNEAVGAWVRMLAWSASHMTDGAIPDEIWPLFTKKPVMNRLVSVGLLDENRERSCYAIHDFLDYNPSAAETMQARAIRAEIGRKGGRESARLRSGNQANTQARTQATTQAPACASVEACLNPGPARPDPYPLRTEEAAQPPPPPGSPGWFCDRMMDLGLGVVAPRWLPILQSLKPLDPKLVEAAVAKARESGSKPSPGLVIRILERWRSEPAAAAKAPVNGSEWQAAQARESEQRRREEARRRPPELEETEEERSRRLESGAMSAKEILGKLGLGGDAS